MKKVSWVMSNLSLYGGAIHIYNRKALVDGKPLHSRTMSWAVHNILCITRAVP